jgi:PKD repeat protein
MTWGWADSMWPDYVPDYPAGQNNAPEWRMGLVLNYGKLYMAGFYPGDSMVDEAVTEFHWYGDPTLEMWAGVPGTMTVTHDPLLPMGAMDFNVNVNVDGALVALTQAGAPLGKAYSSGGSAHIDFDGPIMSIDNVHLVVTRRQYRPYEADLLVGATSDGLVKLDREVYTESSTVGVMVSDADLAGDGTHTLHVASDSEPAGEDVLCEEFLDSGAFFGEIAVTTAASAKGDGVLTIADGDTITLYYHDADTGGGQPADKTDTAYADTASPTFGGLDSAVGGDSQVTLTWSAASDLTPPITYQIYRADDSGGQDFNVPNATTSALTYVDRDLPNMQYFYYVVRATDSLGHQDLNTVEREAMTVGPVTIFEEDFDDKAGIPADWEIVDGGAHNYTWSDENPGGRSDDNWSGVFAIADSDAAGSGKVWNDSLITPAMDCGSYTDVRLLFTHYFDYIDGYGDDHAIVDVSGDGGLTWNNVVNWTGDSRSGLEELAVGAWADGKSAVKFRFTYTGNYDYYWGIDNIQVIGTLGVNPAHISDLTADVTEGPAPLAVQFAAVTTGAISGWLWDFGDGQTSTDASPTHTYETVGQYDVSLSVTGPYGDDQMVKAGMIAVSCPAPTVDFTGEPTSGPAPLAVQFTNATTTYEGCDATTTTWNFGDGGTSNELDPEHTYDHKGNFTVVLTVENPGGANQKSRFWYIKVSAPVDDDDDNDDASPDDDDNDASPGDDDESPDDDDDNDDNDDESPADDDDDDDSAQSGTDSDDDDDSGCGC